MTLYRTALKIFSAMLGVFIGCVVANAAPTMITGAGATFPFPIYSKWFAEYEKVNPEVRINYQSIGSGGGIRQLIEGTVDFGASDAPMDDAEKTKAKRPVLHVPTVLGAVVISYNLDLPKPLRLDSDAIAGIFLGQIKKWNDPALAKLNPDLKLPEKDIVLVTRSDGSGTTAVFTDYLAKVSPAFKEKVGAGKSVQWPVGVGAKGNEGVSGMVKQTPGSLGYIELVYALNNRMAVANVKNSGGKFIEPSSKSVSAAAAPVVKQMIANEFQLSITNSSGKDAYPISSFTWILLQEKISKEKGEKLQGFLKWALGKSGQAMAEDLYYAPLPKALSASVLKKVEQLKFE
mgnify:CR=1 FL=1